MAASPAAKPPADATARQTARKRAPWWESDAEKAAIAAALAAPWEYVEHLAEAPPGPQRTAWRFLGDGGRYEDAVRQNYTGRYPIELLQNAHDACEDAGIVGTVTFVVTRGALLVANEGVPFTAERIESLTRLGSSDKVARRTKRRLIGYKGIGFTAVFEISDRPQIISRTASFSFDRKAAQAELRRRLVPSVRPEVVPARYFPFALPEAAWAEDRAVVDALINEGASTVIRLPLRAGRNTARVAREVLETLAPEVLLFMPAVDRLRFRFGNDNISWSRRRTAKVGTGEVFSLDGTADRRAWLVSRGTVAVSAAETEDLRDDLWKDVRRLNVAVALPWERGRPAPPQSQSLSAYFPTNDRLGRGLLIHGDFYLDSTRRHISGEDEQGVISERVAEKAAQLTARLAESVAEHGIRMLDCLAPLGPPDGFGHRVGEILDEALANARILRSAMPGAKPKRPIDSYRIPGAVTVEDELSLVSMLAKADDLVHPGDDRGPAGTWIEQLGAVTMGSDTFAARIDPVRGGLPYGRALGLLDRWVESLAYSFDAMGALKLRPVVQDTQGRWRRPAEVIWPAEGTPRLPVRLRRAELLVPAYPQAKRFVGRLGITPLTPAAALDIVLAAVRKGTFGVAEDEAEQALDFAWRVWRIDESLDDAGSLGALRVSVSRARGKQARGWRRADAVYAGSMWTRDRSLEQLYGPLGLTEFLAERPSASAPARSERLRFLRAIGVSISPRVVDIDERLPRYSEWRRLPEVRAAWKCVEGRHDSTTRTVVGHVMDRLDAILDRVSADPRLGVALARVLLSLDDPYGEAVGVKCDGASHAGMASVRSTLGYQEWRLASTAWVPVKGDPLGEPLARPSEAWAAVGRGVDPVIVPRSPFRAEDATRLRLVPNERPPLEAIERALTRLALASPELAMAPRRVVDSAETLMRRLERAVPRTVVTAAAPWLPAQADGRAAWSDSPAVGTIPGMPALADLAVIPGGPWAGLRRRYDLPLVREVVEVTTSTGPSYRASALLPPERRVELLAILTRLDVDEKEAALRLAKLRESSHRWLSVSWRVVGGGEAVTGPATFYLEEERNRAGASVRATLLRDGTTRPADGDLGQALAEYLGATDQEPEITLFLGTPAQRLTRHGISRSELSDALRLLGARRWFRDVETMPTQEGEPDETEEARAPTGIDKQTSHRQERNAGTRGEGKKRDLLDPDAVAFGDAQPLARDPDAHKGGRTRGGRGPGDRQSGHKRKSPVMVTWTQPDDEIEARAMRIADRYGRESLGAADVRDVHEQNLGWDLEFWFADGTWTPVEVKGSSGDSFFVITPNEWRAAQEHPEYLLLQVVGIGNPRRGAVREYRDLGALLTEDLLSGLSWAVTGWAVLAPLVIPLTVSAAE
jgi:hypothetical protein